MSEEFDTSPEARALRREIKREGYQTKRPGDHVKSDYVKHLLSTGVYALDKAFYGGLDFGMIHEFYGGESSGKTTTAIRIMAEANKVNYETGEIDLEYSNPCSAFFADMEQTADPVWEKKLGFSREKYGNDVDYISGGDIACDVIKDIIDDDLYSIVVVDCTDQFSPIKVLEADASMSAIGLKAKMIARSMRVWKHSLGKSRLRHKGYPWRVPTIILLSHGQPIFMDEHQRWESTCGNLVKFYCSTRTYLSKFKIETEDKADFGKGKMQGLVKKNKTGAAGRIGTFHMALSDLPKLPAGSVDNVASIFSDLKAFEKVTKVKGGYNILGTVYKTHKIFKDKMYSDIDFQMKIWQKAVELVNKSRGR
jgi:RecA/RadA recombinase